MCDKSQTPATPTLLEASKYWLKLGFVSFGGPAGQIAIMHQDLVENKRWISEQRFLHALNYCMVLPGPEAQQLATYIGWLMHRTWGGVIAGALFVLPSLVILMVLSWVYLRYGNLPVITSVLDGIKPAIVAIVLFAAYRIGSRALKNKWLWAISLLAFIAVAVFNIAFPWVVLSAALIAYIGAKYQPQIFSQNNSLRSKQVNYGVAIIDDDTPTPAHAMYQHRKVIKVLLIGLVIWLLAIGLLLVVFGWQHMLTQMAWFFSKAAMLTFGGAYAVLPYVFQGSVEHYSWLTAPQMMDGLALGETTPGPLIMIVAFVGFVGGWSGLALGVNSALLSGVVAASIVTLFTFLPSFIFIFAGAPFVESTKNNLKLTAPLIGITAAVVGVIVSLAVFFAQHIFMSASQINWLAIAGTILAFFALIKLKLSIIKLVFIFAILGLIKHFVVMYI